MKFSITICVCYIQWGSLFDTICGDKSGWHACNKNPFDIHKWLKGLLAYMWYTKSNSPIYQHKQFKMCVDV